MSIRQSDRSAIVSQSEIRAMTIACNRVNGINMAQGICDLDVPAPVIRGAIDAMNEGNNTYTSCRGVIELRQAIASRMRRVYGMETDPETEIVVSAGATGAFYITCLAALNAGDEVILFEPYYGYHASTVRAVGATPVFVRLRAPDWYLDLSALESAVTKRTRALMINTPANPTGKVFTRSELESIAAFARAHDIIVFTDEIYEHFVYDGRTHIPPATIPGMKERTITISGFSKVFSVTGWRLGYAICPPEIAAAASHFNDLIYVCAPTPLQLGAARGAAKLDDTYYRSIAAEHQEKRDLFCAALCEVGLTPSIPQGAYYVMVDTSGVAGRDDKDRAMHILEKTGIACVPGRAFYHDDAGQNVARFCFAKRSEVLMQGCARMRSLVDPGRSRHWSGEKQQG